MATDSFNRANEDPLSGGGTWTNFGISSQLELVSNQAVSSTGGSCESRYISTFGPDTQMSVVYGAAAGNVQVSLSLGIQDGGGAVFDAYTMSLVDSEAREIVISLFVNGAFSGNTTTSTFPVIATSDTISFSRLGNVLRAGINGVTYLEWTEATLTSAGQVAIGVGSSSDSLDDFSATTANVGYQRLFGPALLFDSATTLYTVPTGIRAELRSVDLNNPSGSLRKITLSIGSDAAATRVVNLLDIPAGESLNLRRGINHTLEAGETLQGYADSADVVVATIDANLETIS